MANGKPRKRASESHSRWLSRPFHIFHRNPSFFDNSFDRYPIGEKTEVADSEKRTPEAKFQPFLYHHSKKSKMLEIFEQLVIFEKMEDRMLGESGVAIRRNRGQTSRGRRRWGAGPRWDITPAVRRVSLDGVPHLMFAPTRRARYMIWHGRICDLARNCRCG